MAGGRPRLGDRERHTVLFVHFHPEEAICLVSLKELPPSTWSRSAKSETVKLTGTARVVGFAARSLTRPGWCDIEEVDAGTDAVFEGEICLRHVREAVLDSRGVLQCEHCLGELRRRVRERSRSTRGGRHPR